MRPKIQKTEMTFTFLHLAADIAGNWSIDQIFHECDHGGFVGEWTKTVKCDVPDDKVEDELLALGKDGEFFNDLLGE
ncbi:MAG: hypothetical protein J7498_01305 [Sphingobium sp.]|nr:hypothetical protein [Sphingobium sp.]